jgi:hypothetical protein
MRAWRLTVFAPAVLALAVAAVRPEGFLLFPTIGGQGLRVGRMAFFWVGVAMALAATWGRGT